MKAVSGVAGAPGTLVWLVYETGVALKLDPPELIAATVNVKVTPFGGKAVVKLVAFRFEIKIVYVLPPSVLRRTL